MSATEPDVRRVDVAGASVFVAVAAEEPRSPAGTRWDVPRVAVPLAAAAAVLGPARWGISGEAVLVAGMLAVLVVLAAIDLRWRLVPNRIVGPALVAVLAFRLATDPGDAAGWLLAALGAPVVLLLPSVLSPGAMGMGDVKLAAVLGASLGAGVVGALVVAFVSVFPVALALLVRRGRGGLHGATLPFAPFLAFGAAVALLA